MIAFADRASKSPAPTRRGRRKAAQSMDFPALVVLIQAAAGQLNAPADLPAVRPGGRLADVDDGVDNGVDNGAPAGAGQDNGGLPELVDAELAGLVRALPTVGYDEVRATLLRLLNMVDGLGL